MSYFTPDVIAREQLFGAWSTPTVVGGDSARYYYPRTYPFAQRNKRKNLLLMVKELLYALKGE